MSGMLSTTNRYAVGMLGMLLLLAGLVMSQQLLADSSSQGVAGVYRVTTDKDMEDVIQDLEFAIGTSNYRISSRNRIGDAISRRENGDFPDAMVIHFCNLAFARRLLEISRDFLVHMPCRVVVWQTPENVVVEVRLVPEHIDPGAEEIVKDINSVLVRIVDISTELWSAGKKP